MIRRDGSHPLPTHRLGRRLRAHRRRAARPGTPPTKRSSTPPGRTSNEAAFLYQLFARQLGTNNLPDCSNMCHESSGVGLGDTIGVGKGTVSLEDFDHADAIFIIGQNPGTNHPRMLSTLQRRRPPRLPHRQHQPAARGGLVRFAHPQHPSTCSAAARLATHYLQVRINGDVALLKGIAKALLAREAGRPGTVLDHAFIAEHTDRLRRAGATTSTHPPGRDHRQSRHPRRDPRPSRSLRRQATIVCWAMGLTQHKNAVDNIQEVVNLLLMRGNFGKPGAGACPVRGHSNVQGDRTMGITEKPKPVSSSTASKPTSASSPPAKTAMTPCMPSRPCTAAKPRSSSPWAATSTPPRPTPRLHRRSPAPLRLTVQSPPSSTAATSSPAAARSSCPASAAPRSTSSRRPAICHRRGLHERRAPLAAATAPPLDAELRSEPAIVAGWLAPPSTPKPSKVDWQGMVDDYDRIRDAIANVHPRLRGLQRPRPPPGGFVLPNGARDRNVGTPTSSAPTSPSTPFPARTRARPAI
jgi:hypothetical protein